MNTQTIETCDCGDFDKGKCPHCDQKERDIDAEIKDEEVMKE